MPAFEGVSTEPCPSYVGQGCDDGFQVCLCGHMLGSSLPRWACSACMPDPVEWRCEQDAAGLCVFDEEFVCMGGCYRFDVDDNLVRCISNGEDPTCNFCSAVCQSWDEPC